jgi:hypothetical protein
MPWDTQIVDRRRRPHPKYKVFSVAIPYEEHEEFKALVDAARERFKKDGARKRYRVYTHEMLRHLLSQYARRLT